MVRISRYSLKIVAIAACCLSLLAGERAFGQVLQGDAAMGSWHDDTPGVRRLLKPQDLPAIAKPTEMGLYRQQRRRGPFPLQERRSQGNRETGAHHHRDSPDASLGA